MRSRANVEGAPTQEPQIEEDERDDEILLISPELKANTLSRM